MPVPLVHTCARAKRPKIRISGPWKLNCDTKFWCFPTKFPPDTKLWCSASSWSSLFIWKTWGKTTNWKVKWPSMVWDKNCCKGKNLSLKKCFKIFEAIVRSVWRNKIAATFSARGTVGAILNKISYSLSQKFESSKRIIPIQWKEFAMYGNYLLPADAFHKLCHHTKPEAYFACGRIS